MLGKRVDITIPNIAVESVRNIPDILDGLEKDTAGIHFTLSVDGHISGGIILVLTLSEAIHMAGILTGSEPDQIKNLGEMEISALKELGNIVIGSYARVLTDGLRVATRYSVPTFTDNATRTIMQEIITPIFADMEDVVIVESEFIVSDEIYRGHLLVMLTSTSVSSVIKALGNCDQ
jgi:chemotaxis protein CheC